jgi:putative heme-binding domain-containing protein
MAESDTLRTWATNAATADRLADACLAVPTPAAAEFLLGHLEQTKFAGARAGEFARHAVLQLPADRIRGIEPLLPSLARSSRLQRVALAEGLATVAAKPGRFLPEQVEHWMHAELVAALTDKDAPLALRAINALKPLDWPGKSEPLRRVALDSAIREANRIAALRALTPTDSATESVLIEVLASPGSNPLRRTAAELLGTATASAAARRALADAFATASADLALVLATSLAKSDAGAEELVDLAAQGRVRTTLLRHRYLVMALEKRPAELRERAAALTRALPPEDARLDAVIAQRVGGAVNAKADATNGAAVFARHCAVCHRFRDTGGNIGPSLDGISSRTVARLIEDILDPSRNVDPAFQLTTITLKNGNMKSGLNFREEAGRVLLADPATGERVELPRSEVAEIAPSPLSAMPPAFDSILSESEFFDLLEYLRAPAK